MTRWFRLAIMVLVLLVASSHSAEANFWDWLEQLSGPGPSTSRGNLMATVYCHGVSSNSGWLRPLDNATSRGPCVFVDVRRFGSDEDTRFFKVHTTITEFGPSYRLAPPVEVGFGLGLIHFDSDGITANRLTLSFPRLVFMPFLLSPSLQNNGGWGFFQVYFRETRIAGDLTQDNFRPKAGNTFSVRHDLVRSTGFIIDAVALVRLIQNH